MATRNALQIQQFGKGDCRWASTYVAIGGAVYTFKAGMAARRRRDMQYGTSSSKYRANGLLV